MAEEKVENLRSTVKGWIKAGVTSIVGLVSGAVIMYLTPVVNNVIKPAKPLANFAAQVNGATAEFNNRSNGGVQGWWDFGDGTALEPFDPKEGIVKHAYASPGTYSVKLSLQNLIGEESERTAPVTIGTAEASSAPEVAEFALEAINNHVPAAYRIRCKTKNVNLCLLSSGDGRPPEIVNGVALDGHSVSFSKKGAYTVSVFAINGSQFTQKNAEVTVGGSYVDTPAIAKLSASYDAVQIERREKPWKFHCAWPADEKGAVAALRREREAEPGCTILSATLEKDDDKASPMRNFNLEISTDKRKLILTGELVKPGGLLTANTALPSWLARVNVVMEHRSPVHTFNRGEVPMGIPFNHPVKISTQRPGPGWQVLREQVNLEIWDGNHKAWSGNSGVTNAPVILDKQACYLTVLPQVDGFLVTVDAPSTAPAQIPRMVPTPAPVPAPAPIAIAPPVVDPIPDSPPRYGPYIRPTSFERNPLLPQKKTGN